MKIKTAFFIGILLLISQPANSMGMGDWSYKTKNGTTIAGAGGVWFPLKGGGINRMKKWYYYKDFIIGHNNSGKNDLRKYSYFIFNEISGEIETYTSQKEWRHFILKKELKPKIITRWFSHHSSPILTLLVFYTMILSFLMLPIYYLVYLFLKDVFVTEKFNIKMPFSRIFLFVVCLIIVKIILALNVQSF